MRKFSRRLVKFFKSHISGGVIILVLLILGSAITVFALQQLQNTRSRAALDAGGGSGGVSVPSGYTFVYAQCQGINDLRQITFCQNISIQGGTNIKEECVIKSISGGVYPRACTLDFHGMVADCRQRIVWIYNAKDNVYNPIGSTTQFYGNTYYRWDAYVQGGWDNAVRNSSWDFTVSNFYNNVLNNLCYGVDTSTGGGTVPACGTGSASGGVCQYSSCGSDQTYVNGKCDGSSMVCCTRKPQASTAPPPPPPQGGGPVGVACTASQGKKGVCQDRNTTACAGYYDSGNYCPGGASIQCCISDQVACNATSGSPKGQGICHNSSGKNTYSCVGGYNSGNFCPGPQDVQCCVQAQPASAATATPTSTATPTRTPTPTKNPTATPTITPTLAPKTTTFTFDLSFHGIGKGGDNSNPNGGGNQNPLHKTRSIVVEVYDLDDNFIVTKQGSVAYDSVSGGYKGSVVMGTTLKSQPYVIKVKLSHSLRRSVTRNITAGTTNSIPLIKLINGDANNDARLDIADYNIILGCYTDFGLSPTDCNVTKSVQADIDDDGQVNQFDLNLFLREMSVQQL